MTDRGENTDINWGLAASLTLIGLGFMAWSLWIDGFSSQGWSAVLVEVGAGLALIAIIVIAERNLLRRIRSVTQTAATEAAERATADLEKRVLNLETLDEAAAAERQKRRQAERAAVEELVEGALNAEAVLELVATGFDDGLFDDDYETKYFRVRTSTEPDCHLLYFHADRALEAVSVDFHPISLEADFDTGQMLPRRSPTILMWDKDKDASRVASDLEATLERINQPTHGFSLAHSLRQLIASYEAMRAARKAPADSALRLQGRLRVLINGRWALTSHGLEDLESDEAYTAQGTIKQGHIRGLRLTGGPPATDTPGWEEAVEWMEERERAEFELAPF